MVKIQNKLLKKAKRDSDDEEEEEIDEIPMIKEFEPEKLVEAPAINNK